MTKNPSVVGRIILKLMMEPSYDYITLSTTPGYHHSQNKS